MSEWPCCCGENLMEAYYGWRCRVCATLIPFGCEPWMPMDDNDACPGDMDIEQREERR